MTYRKGCAPPRIMAAVVLAGALMGMSACSSATSSPSAGIDVAGMDKSVAPGDDFNLYTNGGWITSTPMPADKASYGTFSIIIDDTRKRMLSLIEESSNAQSPNEDMRKIRDYYSSFMDEAAIE